jgi:hypothetical protein
MTTEELNAAGQLPKPIGRVVGDGYPIFSWPEFRALMKVFGIPDYKVSEAFRPAGPNCLEGVEFRLDEGELCTVHVKYFDNPYLQHWQVPNKDGYGIFHTPQFIAFATRFGVPLTTQIKWISFVICEGRVATYTTEICAVDMQAEQQSIQKEQLDVLQQIGQTMKDIVKSAEVSKSEMVGGSLDTTTCHNEEFRTSQPTALKTWRDQKPML